MVKFHPLPLYQYLLDRFTLRKVSSKLYLWSKKKRVSLNMNFSKNFYLNLKRMLQIFHMRKLYCYAHRHKKVCVVITCDSHKLRSIAHPGSGPGKTAYCRGTVGQRVYPDQDFHKGNQ